MCVCVCVCALFFWECAQMNLQKKKSEDSEPKCCRRVLRRLGLQKKGKTKKTTSFFTESNENEFPHSEEKKKESLDKNTQWLQFIASTTSRSWLMMRTRTVSIACRRLIVFFSSFPILFWFSSSQLHSNFFLGEGGTNNVIEWITHSNKTSETEKLKRSKRIQCAELMAIRCVLLPLHHLFVSF